MTKDGLATVTVAVAPASGAVVAPGFAFTPATVDVQAGGAVSWTFGAIDHTVTFTTAGAPGQHASALQRIRRPAPFRLTATSAITARFIPQMTGMVHVH